MWFETTDELLRALESQSRGWGTDTEKRRAAEKAHDLIRRLTSGAPGHWVLMGNDYPDAILIGTEEQAEAEAKRRSADDPSNKERARVHWRVYPFEPVRLGEEKKS
jgi:hypothetical protein